jgi:hypothetical protein
VCILDEGEVFGKHTLVRKHREGGGGERCTIEVVVGVWRHEISESLESAHQFQWHVFPALLQACDGRQIQRRHHLQYTAKVVQLRHTLGE